MSILTWIDDNERLKLLNASKYVRPSTDSNKGLWTRCDKCGVILYIKHLIENQRVCFGCAYHLQMNSPERIQNLLDKESWRPFDETVSPCDPLHFHDQKNYTDRLQAAQDKTGLQDAIQTGSGRIEGIPVALGVMDFDFMGGSMGSVVGEKVTRLIEYATQEGLTLILICASGGARMQEGVFGLMQMAKISSALRIYQSCANLLYISILSSPTTGGVTASFGMLGDIIFAEPRALIAFAGRRVIEQTLCEDLPEDFQSSEYMLNHGLVDLIVPRRFLRQALSESIKFYKNAPFKKTGKIPFGVQNPISFVTEEKIRRQWKDQVKWERPLAEHSSTTPTRARKNEAVLDRTACKQLSCAEVYGYTKASFLYKFTVLHKFTFCTYKRSFYLLEKSKLFAYKNKASVKAQFLYNSVYTNTPSLQKLCKNKRILQCLYVQTEDPYNKNSVLSNRTGGSNSFALDRPQNVDSDKKHAFNLPMRSQDQMKSSLERLGLRLPGSKDPAKPYSRNQSRYRSILSSFQMIFSLFHKQSVLPDLNDVTDLAIYTNDFMEQEQSLQRFESVLKSNDETKVAALSDAGDFESTAPDRLHSKEHAFDSQGLTGTKQPPYLYKTSDLRARAKLVPTRSSAVRSMRYLQKGNFLHNFVFVPKVNFIQKQSLCKSEAFAYKNKDQPSTLIDPEKGIDFLNQAIELAATESIEWRAFYVSQRISKTRAEDFFQPEVELTLKSSEDVQSSLKKDNTILHNTLFYKSICRSTSR